MAKDKYDHTRSSTLSSMGDIICKESIRNVVKFEGLDGLDCDSEEEGRETGEIPRRGMEGFKPQSNRSLLSAPAAPPHAHKRTSLLVRDFVHDRNLHSKESERSLFGGLSLHHAYRSIRQEERAKILQRKGWTSRSATGFTDGTVASETTPLIKGGGDAPALPEEPDGLAQSDDTPLEALKEMILNNKINLLFVFIPLAYWSHAAGWSDGSVFILNFLAMVPLASLLGVFTEELAAHTNDLIGGLINASFGNAVELVVAVQALLHYGEE
jgi:hypothetical protein